MRTYEELLIVQPDTPEEQIDAFIEQLKSVITSAGGVVDKEEKWGVRKLAYKIEKRSEGYYILIQFTAGPEPVAEIEHRMRVTDFVMRWISVRIDEKLKKLAKRTKQREKRAKRRPPVERPVPAAVSAPTPGTPAPGVPAAQDVAVAEEPAPAVETQE